jgi:hypothetical protein
MQINIMEKAKNEFPHTDLMQALNFSFDDLEANRAGKFSQRQWNGRRINIMVSLFFVLFCGGLAGIFIIGTQRGDGMAFWLAIIFSFITISLMWHLKTILSMRGDVRILRGAIRKKYNYRRGSNPSGCVLQVGQADFGITPQGFNAMDERHTYYLYIEPLTKQVLTAEAVTE